MATPPTDDYPEFLGIKIMVERKSWRKFLWAFSVLAAILGPWMVYRTVLGLQWAFASRTWPTTEGWVVRSEVRRSGDSGSEASVFYSYRVNGIPFSSHTVSFGHAGSPYQIVSRYRVGEPVIVHYNPESPDIATLETGASWWNYFWIVFTLLICWGGVWGCRYLWRTRPGVTTETG